MSDHLAPIPWFDVALILALIALNGVLAMSELAIVSSREARLKAMAKSGRGGAQCALDLASDPGRFLSTVQSGITLISIFAGAFSGASLGEPVAQRLQTLGLEPETAHTAGFALVIILTTYVSLVNMTAPPLTALLAWVLFREILGWTRAAGTAVATPATSTAAKTISHHTSFAPA